MRSPAFVPFPPPPPTTAELIGRGAWVRLAYRLGRARATGVATLSAGGDPEAIIIRHGDVLCESVDPGIRQLDLDAARSPARLYSPAHRLENKLRRMAALEGARYWFTGGTVGFPRTPLVRVFPLALWARRHLEGQMDANRARALVQELAGVRLAIRPGLAPDRSLCDKTDMRIVEAMHQPLRLDQIWPLARTPRFRLLAFLHFLRSVDALAMIGVAAPAPHPRPELQGAHRLLGVAQTADRETLKRAYRRMARALHPDLHPEASSDRRRDLERKLAAVTDAYRALSAAL